MSRCALMLAFVLAATFVASSPASAQAARKFPATALRGELVVTQPPQVLVNRQPARLAPGARIRGTDNMLVMSGAVVGQRLLVHYTMDLTGHLLDVWILTEQEALRRPWPSTPAEAASWAFNPDAQIWSKP